ncbi:Eno2 [Symbiodinium natans]|uniref:Eno2 protein n=1 Tax=Symbiodinium natans TaxID=878477 RepID=A0A812G9H9_9DINO|nr:Eno2 [Symbiodinium natans]
MASVAYKDFLKDVLGGAADEIEERDEKLLGQNCDIFAIPEDKEDSNEEEEKMEDKAGETVCFAMDSSDDDNDSDVDSEEWDLEDAYNFDPERVAELLKNPDVSEEDLVESLQETMAEAMILRMTAEDPDVEASRPTCQEDISGLMTPPAQPATFDATTPDPKELSKKLEQVPGRVRRSSINRRGALDDVAKSAVKNHRKSIACIASAKMGSDEGNKDKIQQALTNSKKRHRMSMCKAVEMLDLAGFRDEEDKEVVSNKLETLQKCVLKARALHRQTVAKVALETVGGDLLPASELAKAGEGTAEASKDGNAKASSSAEKPRVISNLSASAREFKPSAKQESIEQKIKNAVKAAHQRAQKEQGTVEPPPRGYDEWGNPYAQGWGSHYQQCDYGYVQGYDQGYNTGYNQMYSQGCGQAYDPTWNNGCGYAQGSPPWQQMPQQQNWMQGNPGQNCWMTPEGAQAAYGSNCYNYYGGNYAGYGQSQQPSYGGPPWQNAAWGSA